MKSIVKTVYIICSLVFLIYLAPPNIDFPEKPPNSLQSDEPGDTESTLRRAYFTDLTREEVVKHYTGQMKLDPFLGYKLPNYKLNYPPEEAFGIIRDQTRSTFLEEILYPLRESLFVNGFVPKEDKDRIFINEKEWKQKITVRYIPSNIFHRLLIGIFTIFLIPFLAARAIYSVGKLKSALQGLWT